MDNTHLISFTSVVLPVGTRNSRFQWNQGYKWEYCAYVFPNRNKTTELLSCSGTSAVSRPIQLGRYCSKFIVIEVHLNPSG
ncbi:hypothetical protein FGIG_09260 [Fasciola gigantica]|uniref:Uncharacterized protein n=1 Tax=Fasciola gigantica TaxID=46835 RepID=A0A504YMV5_FASGI|nr:hypothetical protein FGIG_09260 [Fasciola gigantica]